MHLHWVLRWRFEELEKVGYTTPELARYEKQVRAPFKVLNK
jgi:hypothetical protein